IFALNLATGMRYPAVWSDEAMYSDPAIHFVLGKGFTSTAWYVQTGDKFWAGNTPLHALALIEWVRLFGLSPLAVRSINYFWFVAGTFFVWRFCVRAQLAKRMGLRLLLIALLACDSGVSFSYRSGRPDMIGYCLCAAALWAATISSRSVRYISLVLLGFLFPWAGMQLLPFLALAAGLILIFFGRRAALNGVCAGIGAAIGLVGLYIFYQSHGVWNDFMASVKLHASGEMSKVYGHAQLNVIPEMLMRDRSAPFLLLLTIILIWWCWKNRNAVSTKISLFALAAGFCIPVGMHLIGIFPIYYGWMAALPVTLAICHYLSLQPLASPWIKVIAFVLLSSAILVGLPMRLGVAALRLNEQPYSVADKFVANHLNSSDNVYIDYMVYYPAIRTANKIYMLRYFQNVMTPEEKHSLTALVIRPEEITSLTNALGADWKLTAEYKSDSAPTFLPEFLAKHFQGGGVRDVYAPYRFAIYRRNSGTPLQTHD
ncbi:MAG TPA: hypothetical protein VK810_00190, partial [Dongiaceae bacterium]|nr:hypothetical protein [Dongiaceae bacterium]